MKLKTNILRYLVIIGLIIFSFPLFSFSEQAVISYILGTVRVTTADGNRVMAYNNMLIQEGSRLQTDSEGVCEITLENGSKIRIMNSSVVNLMNITDSIIVAVVDRGSVYSRATLNANQQLQIGTPAVLAGVRGTWFGVSHNYRDNTSNVDVAEGEVAVSNPNFPDAPPVSVGPGKGIRVSSSAPPSLNDVTEMTNDQLRTFVNNQVAFGEEWQEPDPVDVTPPTPVPPTRTVQPTPQVNLTSTPAPPTPAPTPVPPTPTPAPPTPAPTPAPPTPTVQDTQSQTLSTPEPDNDQDSDSSDSDSSDSGSSMSMPEVPDMPADTDTDTDADTDGADGTTELSADLSEGLELPDDITGQLPDAEQLFGFAGALGPVSFGDDVYTQITLNPRFNFDVIAFGLYLPIYFRSPLDDDLSLREKIANYDQYNFDGVKDGIGDFFSLFEFINLNLNFDSWKLLIKYGNIKEFNFGHGFIVNGFTNATAFPTISRLGLQVSLDIGYAGLETMIGDLRYDDMRLTGVRVYGRPIYGMPVFGDLHIGVSFVVDTNPLGGEVGSNPSVSAFGIDAGLPLLDNAIISLMYYADYATLGYDFTDVEATLDWAGEGLSSKNQFFDFGNSGIGTGVKGLIISMISYQIEYRRIWNGYVPSFFDRFYDFARHDPEKLNSIIYSDSEADYNGILGSLGFVWEGVGHIKGSFENLMDKPWSAAKTDPVTGEVYYPASDKNYLHLELAIYEDVIPYFYFTFAYDRKDIRGWTDFKENFLSEHSMLSLIGAFQLGSSVDIFVTWQRMYVNEYDETTGAYDLVSEDSFGISTEITFF